ncbi:phosphotransferase [Blastococcus sp. TF02A_35]|uniref:phosphotransferase n=1 Tax=Blastococcus sp. TF02A-35 TaxID=2559612 RepID=UPI0010743991|nr:phosphotransferase [Blastococcus sp. TF02A_35]TFV52066.1 hypothetical protein E4P43_07415 [Blastococcus sp. TF02A_35]
MRKFEALGQSLWREAPWLRECEFRPYPDTPTQWARTFLVRRASGRPAAVLRKINLSRVTASDVRAEFEVAARLGREQLGPAVIAADTAAGELLMAHIDAQSAVRPNRSIVAEAARVLRQLHAVAPDEALALHKSKRRVGIDRIRGEVGASPELRRYQIGMRAYDDLRGKLSRGRGIRALCHNDLNPTNMLVSRDRVWLIDFDHVGMGDVFFDVATAAGALQLTSDAAGNFLEDYLGRTATADEMTRFRGMSRLVLLRYGLDTLSLITGCRRRAVQQAEDYPLGVPFVFDRLPGEELDAAVARLSRAFLEAGIAAHWSEGGR